MNMYIYNEILYSSEIEYHCIIRHKYFLKTQHELIKPDSKDNNKSLGHSFENI